MLMLDSLSEELGATASCCLPARWDSLMGRPVIRATRTLSRHAACVPTFELFCLSPVDFGQFGQRQSCLYGPRSGLTGLLPPKGGFAACYLGRRNAITWAVKRRHDVSLARKSPDMILRSTVLPEKGNADA